MGRTKRRRKTRVICEREVKEKGREIEGKEGRGKSEGKNSEKERNMRKEREGIAEKRKKYERHKRY